MYGCDSLASSPVVTTARVHHGSCIWLRKATLVAFSRVIMAAVFVVPFGHGDMHGVEHKLLLRSHWSSSRNISSADGPPVIFSWAICVIHKNLINTKLQSQPPLFRPLPVSPLAANSKAVVRSHICIAPFEWPDKMKRRGRDPIRDDPSHSCTQNDVTVVPSTERITQIRSPFDAKRTYNWSVSGTTFCTNTCSSSCSPNGPKSLPAA